MVKISTTIEVPASRLPARGDYMLRPYIAQALDIDEEDILSYELLRRSVDARKRGYVLVQYALEVGLRDGVRPKGKYGQAMPRERWRPELECSIRHPLIVGAGPAGLFAALVLAEAGAEPIILERGRDVVRRKKDIESFLATRQLNTESNYLYGEGGAGTWSDGKLFTRVHDVRADYVLRCFVQAGAPKEILYFSHPHIGSDLLPGVIAALRRRIIASGGHFIWDSCVEEVEGDACFRALRLSDGSRIEAPACIIACGHSARKLILSLTRRIGFEMKPFQMGCRIEHPQRFINQIRYGREESFPVLGAAEYLFSCHGYGRVPGATSFCMCPGGQIIPATCTENMLATNGMSNSQRNGKYANAAIISTLPADSFTTPEQAFSFLESIEKKVFTYGGSDYTAPAQRAADFLDRRASITLHEGTYPLGLCPGRLDKLATPVYDALANALRVFDKQTPGFIRLGMLTGVETRVSSPVRFTRNEDGSSTMAGLYLAGEGAGMAGGIVSAAIDGIKAAQSLAAMGR